MASLIPRRLYCWLLLEDRDTDVGETKRTSHSFTISCRGTKCTTRCTKCSCSCWRSDWHGQWAPQLIHRDLQSWVAHPQRHPFDLANPCHGLVVGESRADLLAAATPRCKMDPEAINWAGSSADTSANVGNGRGGATDVGLRQRTGACSVKKRYAVYGGQKANTHLALDPRAAKDSLARSCCTCEGMICSKVVYGDRGKLIDEGVDRENSMRKAAVAI